MRAFTNFKLLRQLLLGSVLLASAAGCVQERKPNQTEPLPLVAPSAQQPPGKVIVAGYSTPAPAPLNTPLGLRRLEPVAANPQDLAVDALGRIGRPAIPALVQALEDPNPVVRQNAARALARIGPDAADAVPKLIVALNDSNAEVRQIAARALGQIGPAAADAVPALVDDLRPR